MKGKVKDHFDKKQQEKEEIQRMQREADFQQKQIFNQEFKKNVLEVAKARAKKDAAKASGIQKLRAENRLRDLNKKSPSDPGSFLSKFQEYTQNNLARREENMKKTDMMREEGKKIQGERLNRMNQSPQMRKPFDPSGFRKGT